MIDDLLARTRRATDQPMVREQYLPDHRHRHELIGNFFLAGR
jgi:hypothetical protein